MNIVKYIAVFLLVLLTIANQYFAQCNTTAINLNTWTANGGSWTVSADGSYVDQTVNGGNVYFISPQPYINVLIEGILRTDDTDDDKMGFVFGVEGTIGVGNFHYYRFEWDEGGHGNGMYVKEYDQTGLVATLLSLPGNHWTRGFDHHFTLLYQTSRIRITMDNIVRLDIGGCYNPGDFGFFNSSQAYVRYSGFQYTPMTDFSFTTGDNICIYDQLQTNIFCLNTGNNPYAEIRWDFGDGTTISNVVSAQHTYSSGGVYNVELYVRDFFGCEDSITKQVTVYDPSFSLGPDQIICPSTTTTFSPDNTNNGDTFMWSSGQTTPTITTGTPGSYILTKTDANNCVARDTVALSIINLPQVNFSASPVCEYDTMTYTNLTPNTQSVVWDFGDGATSTQEPAYHKYANDGSYPVKLVVTYNQGCKDSTAQNVTIYEQPIADFNFQDNCFNQVAVFTDASSIATGNISNWNWDLGDGTTENLQNVNRLYASDGSYNVQLIVESNNNCFDTVQKTITRYPLPQVSFSTVSQCEYTALQFTDESTINTPDNNTSWNWNFGQGITANTQNPSILFPDGGTKTVKLIVTSNHGCKDSTVANIEVFHKPVADFISSDDCNNLPATFVNNSSVTNSSITSWIWNFGDGSPNMLSQNASHQYASAGQYNTELIVTSSEDCKDTIVKTVERYPVPTASFTYTEDCQYTPLEFTNQSSVGNGNSIIAYTWNFGDGSPVDNNENTNHLYNGSGLYQVKLTVTSNNSCIDDTTINVNVYPVPMVNFSTSDKCINEGNNNFFNSSAIASGSFSQWAWDFGDGFTSNLSAPAHHYSMPGDYQVTLIGTSNHNCNDTITKTVSIFNKPTALFSSDTTGGCVPVCVNFQDNSTDDHGIMFREWSFEGHEGSVNQTPSLCFEEDGEFNVELIVTNMYNCKDTALAQDFIITWPNPVADFSISNPETDILNPIIYFENNSYDADKWLWNLGNGVQDSTNYNTSETYEQAGYYTISLFVENDFGCKDSITKGLNVASVPFFYIPNSFTPNGDGINDVFAIKGENFNFEELIVFDRWGKQIFQTSKIDGTWDGTHKGTELPTGTYVWVIKYKDKEGNDQTEKGDVTLIK